MPDEIHFHKSPDGTVKQLVCLAGIDDADQFWNFLKEAVDGATLNGMYLAHIDNSAEISNETGGNPGWGMTIENKRRDKALLIFKPVKK